MQSNQCKNCQHYQRENELGKLHCLAFPKGIPEEIITGEFDHHKKYEGDQGFRWEEAEILQEK